MVVAVVVVVVVVVRVDERNYVCQCCDKAFRQQSHLNQHFRIHTGEKPYRCKFENCERAFAQLSNLQHHMRNHDDQVKKEATRIHKCQICHRCYTNESSLKAHTLKMHIHIKPIDQHALAMGKKRRKRKNKDLYGGAPTMVPVSSSGDGGSAGFDSGPGGAGGPGMSLGLKGPRTRSPTSSDDDEIIFVGEQGGSSRMDNFGLGPAGAGVAGLGGQGQMLGQGSGGRAHDLGHQIPFSSMGSFSRSADPLALLASANRFGLQDNMMPGLGSGLGSGLNSFSDQLAFRDAALLNSRFGDLRGGNGGGGSGGLSSSGSQGGPPGSGFDDRFLGSSGNFGGSGGLGGQLNQQQLQRDRDGFGDLGGSGRNNSSGNTSNGMQSHNGENRNLAHNQGMLRGSGLGGSNGGGMGMGGMMGGMMGHGGAGGLMKQIKQEPMDYFPSSCHGGPGSDQFSGMGMGMGGGGTGGFLSPQHLINSHLRGQLPSLNVPLIRDHFTSSHGQMLPSTSHPSSSSSASSSASSTTTPVTNNQPPPSSSSSAHPPTASTPSSLPLPHPASSTTPTSLSSLPLPLSHMGLYQHQPHFPAPRGLLHPSPASTPSSQLSVGGGAGPGLPSNLSTQGARSPLEQEDLRCFSPLRN
ncbi:Zinc finger protein 362 [Plakobranchus ocellatus]|uniref:Zinc finger protein 362 n=1 Tax=Plakobranchus ocellatus TaxID=259542 RepID=A0AAV4APA0_9GAST|nr:Zinc finger protein 362 [Plakobranchus ocellatus]